jgi:hypothetical protein
VSDLIFAGSLSRLGTEIRFAACLATKVTTLTYWRKKIMQAGFILVAGVLTMASSAQADVVDICDAADGYLEEGKKVTIAGLITNVGSIPIVGTTKHQYYYSLYITDNEDDCIVAINPPITIRGTCAEDDQVQVTGITKHDSLKFTELYQATVTCK